MRSLITRLFLREFARNVRHPKTSVQPKREKFLLLNPVFLTCNFIAGWSFKFSTLSDITKFQFQGHCLCVVQKINFILDKKIFFDKAYINLGS